MLWVLICIGSVNSLFFLGPMPGGISDFVPTAVTWGPSRIAQWLLLMLRALKRSTRGSGRVGGDMRLPCLGAGGSLVGAGHAVGAE